MKIKIVSSKALVVNEDKFVNSSVFPLYVAEGFSSQCFLLPFLLFFVELFIFWFVVVCKEKLEKNENENDYKLGK